MHRPILKLILGFSLCVSQLALAEPFSFDFDRDPTDDDFQLIAREYANPFHPTFVRPPANPGSRYGLGASYGVTSVSKKAFDRAQSYFEDSANDSVGVTTFNFESYLIPDAKNGSFSWFVNYSTGTRSKISMYTLGLRVGSEFLGARFAYTTEAGLDHVAICGYNGEGVIGLPIVIGTIYGAYGLSSMGVGVFTNAMSAQYETTWTDRYATVGFVLQPLRNEGKGSSANISLAGEAQYATTPKQVTFLGKFAFDL